VRIIRIIRRASAAKSLITTIIGYGAVEVVSRSVQAAAIFILAYHYPKNDFGNFYTYFAAYQLATVLSTGGLLESFMGSLAKCRQNSDEARQLAAAFIKRYFYRAVLISAAAAIAGAGINEFSTLKINLHFFAAAILGGNLYGLVTFLSNYLTCSGLNRQSIALRTSYTVLAYALSVFVAIAAGTIFAFFWGMCAAGLATLLLAPREARLWRYFSIASNKMAASRTGADWFLVPGILNWFFWYGLVVCVQRYFGPVHAAELAFANTIASVLTMINSSISQAWLSRYLARISQSQRATEEQNAFVFKLQSLLMIIVTVSTIAGYELLRAAKFPLVLKYDNLGLEIAILLFSVSISSGYFAAINSFAVNNQGRRLAYISLAAYVTSIAVLLSACLAFGVLGVYVGLAALVISRGFAITYSAMRTLKAGFFDPRLFILNLALFLVVTFYYAA